MTDLIVVPQSAQWQHLKRLVLDSVSSPIIPLRVEIVEAASLGKDEALTLKPAAYSYIVVSVQTAIVLDVVIPVVGDVLQE